jgi:hypothetical protein
MDAAFRGEPARRAADPRADIENVLAGPRLEQFDKLLGRDDAAAVEMVEHRQRLDRDRRVRAVRRLECGEDALGDPGAAVMPRDVGLDSHARFLALGFHARQC